MNGLHAALLSLALMAGAGVAAEPVRDPARDILVTLHSTSAGLVSGGHDAPFRKRKRYATPLTVEVLASDIASDYALVEITRWPIDSLSVLCIVFRVSDAGERDETVNRLLADPRIDSAQNLLRFDARGSGPADYDDTYAALQQGLAIMGIPAAHRYSQGRGVRIGVVDGAVDLRHEDLAGRISAVRDFTEQDRAAHGEHGTAVVSVIAASANNARGIVGVAPEAEIEIYVACWTEADRTQAVCDSFTLAKALDTLLQRRPDIVNLSLSGPYDPLLDRLLEQIAAAGTLVVAATPPSGARDMHFPASRNDIVGVTPSSVPDKAVPVALRGNGSVSLHAPGDRIIVALPSDSYDFRSGSSLAAAHVSGAAALLLSVSPQLAPETVVDYLRASERYWSDGTRSIDACVALQRDDASRDCPQAQ